MNKFLISACAVLIASPALADSVTMQIDGNGWASTVVNTTAVPIGGMQVISISAKLEGDKISRLALQITPVSPDSLKGHYDLKSGPPQKAGAGGTFNVDLLGGDPMEDSFSFQSGVLDITAYDPAAKTLSGTFSGLLANHAGTKKAAITNGAIDQVIIGP